MHAKTDLESFARNLPPGSAKDLVERVLADPYEAALAALRIAMQMGANENWDGGADYLDWIADEVGYTGTFAHPGDSDNNSLYRQLADAAGMGYDAPEEDE